MHSVILYTLYSYTLRIKKIILSSNNKLTNALRVELEVQDR